MAPIRFSWDHFCRGIAVVESELVSEAAVSLAPLRLLQRFDVFDYLSLREENGDLAPRG